MMGRDIMQREHIHIRLDRDAVYAAIWPLLSDDIHRFGFEFISSSGRMSGAEGYALEYLLDQIEGNAFTPVEAIAMARDLMADQPNADDYDDARFVPLWYVVLTTPEALKTISALLAATPSAARLIGDTVYFERRDEADWIVSVYGGDVIGISLADPTPPPPQLRQLQRLAAKQRGAGYYSKHYSDQKIEAIINRASTGEPLSEYEQDFLRELDHEDHGTAEERNPC
jgi:hypothetical protein